MSRDEIIFRVMQCVDEITPNNSGNYGLEYPVERFLDDAAIEVLRLAPLQMIDKKKDFSGSEHQVLEGGTGKIKLPEKFIRLSGFKMSCWEKPVFEYITHLDKKYLRQHNPITRGGVSRPVVLIDSGYLYYYSVPQNIAHIIERAEAVVEMIADENYPSNLIDPLCWMTAYKILLVMNDLQAAANAKLQFQEVIGILTNR